MGCGSSTPASKRDADIPRGDPNPNTPTTTQPPRDNPNPNPNTPTTPSTQPPPPTPSSDSSSNHSRCEDYVNALAKALVKVANKYIKLDEAALEKGNNFDDFVEVELPDGEYPSMNQLGEAAVLAESSVKATGKLEAIVGKMKLVAFPLKSQVLVRQVASGHRHGEALSCVVMDLQLDQCCHQG